MIHWIPTSDDPRLGPYRHVADPAWLRRYDLFVAEGRLVVERLMALDASAIQSVLVNRAAHDALHASLSVLDANVYVCDDEVLRGLTGFNFHRGCLALAARPAPRAAAALAGTRLLAIEAVGNPDNVGGLFRTAAAFGVDGVLLSATAGDPLYRKAIRTSMAASLSVPWARADDWVGELERRRRDGYTIVALTPDPDATPIGALARDLDARTRLIVLVGAEGAGLNEATMALAQLRVRIPIVRAVDSLNVVVAAGIALSWLAVPQPPG